MEKELVISAKEYVRYETELMDDFIEFLSGKEMLRENSSASLVSPESSRRRTGNLVSVSLSPVESMVRIKKNSTFYSFPRYKRNRRFHHTLLPSNLVPCNSKRKARVTLPPIGSVHTVRTVHTLPKQEPVSSHNSCNTHLPAVQIDLPAKGLDYKANSQHSFLKSDGNPTCKNRKSRRQILLEEEKVRPTTPKPYGDCDSDHFSLKNIEEAEPGTVKLSIYYHEPSKQIQRVLLPQLDNHGMFQQQMKGLIFDKQSLSYHPPDPGPLKQRCVISSMGSLVNVLLFQVQLNSRMKRVKNSMQLAKNRAGNAAVRRQQKVRSCPANE